MRNKIKYIKSKIIIFKDDLNLFIKNKNTTSKTRVVSCRKLSSIFHKPGNIFPNQQ